MRFWNFRCTPKFADLSAPDAAQLWKVKVSTPTSTSGASSETVVSWRDPNSFEEFSFALLETLPDVIVEWADAEVKKAATEGNVFTAPVVHMLPLLFLAPSKHANLEALKVLYGLIKFADIDLSSSTAQILAGHWPSVDLFASALTPTLRDMEASIKGVLENETGWRTMPVIPLLNDKSLADLAELVKYVMDARARMDVMDLAELVP